MDGRDEQAARARAVKNQVKRVLRSVGLYRPAAAVWGFLREPGQKLGYQACRLVMRLTTCSPGSASYRLIDRFYTSHKRWVRKARSLFAEGTAQLNRLTSTGQAPGQGPVALVFLLRGPAYGPNLHNYLVGCELRRLGYRVSFVVCGGSVERCGLNKETSEPETPPFTCGGCRQITGALSSEGFGVVNLNDYKPDHEDETVDRLAPSSRDELLNYELDGIRAVEVLRPFLMRYYSGNYAKVESNDQEMRSHLKAGLRFLLRYKNLLDRTRPSCLCFFNGLFFPEHFFLQEARARGIPALFVERGMRRNTVFISVNEAACHYRCDRLWERVKGQITDDQLRATAAYMAQRVGGPEDVQGRRREVSCDDPTPYASLASRPYVVLFAPVTHDTTCMEKNDPAGGFLPALGLLCSLAIRLRKRLVVRAHPDERGPLNPSCYTVRQHMKDHGLLDSEYVVCLDSDEQWNPYLLAGRADAVVVYNGTLGCELPALGYEVFNIARSHYSHKGFTRDLDRVEDFAQVFTSRQRTLSPTERELALKYVYFYVHVSNLSVDQLLDEYVPFHYTWVAGGDAREQEEQLAAVRQRLAFLLDLPGQGAGCPAGAGAGGLA